MMQLALLRRFCYVLHVRDLPEKLVPALLRRLDERTARIEDRLATIERRMALRDQEIAIDRAELLALSGRVARIERRHELESRDVTGRSGG